MPSRLLLGDKKRLAQRHFAEAIRQVSGCPDGCLGVAQGDTIPGGCGEWEILWPPREVWLDGPYGRIMQSGVEAFRAAAEVDDDLRRAYEATAEAGVAEEYSASFGVDDHQTEDDRPFPRDEQVDYEGDDDEWPQEIDPASEDWGGGPDRHDAPQKPLVVRANQALRKVADLFSLAFQAEPQILFLADLRPREIRAVVTRCSRSSRARYHILVSSHHGTRWHSSLQHLSIQSAVVSSVGGKLCDLVRSEYGGFGVKHFLTSKHGHLALNA